MPPHDIQMATNVATLIADVRNLTEQVSANRQENREYRAETRERFDQIDERLDRGDAKFEAIALQASQEQVMKSIREKIGDVFLHLFSGSVGVAIIYIVQLFWPPPRH